MFKRTLPAQSEHFRTGKLFTNISNEPNVIKNLIELQKKILFFDQRLSAEYSKVNLMNCISEDGSSD